MVTNPASGLRFDIYERVHLPDDAAAIEELEEIELVPHMQALKQADQTVLKGHLLLTGIYRSSDRETATERLEHWIPVEISLPSDRVQRDVDLAVEIDNFDVDLLSTRSLNVTGVLALRGVRASQSQQPVWRDDSFTVVHEADTQAVYEKKDEQKLQAALETEAEQMSGQAERNPDQSKFFPEQAEHMPEQGERYPEQTERLPAQSKSIQAQSERIPEQTVSDLAEYTSQQAERNPEAERTDYLPPSESSGNAELEAEWGDLSAYSAQQEEAQSDVNLSGETTLTADNKPGKTDLKIAFGVSSDREAAKTPGVELLSKMSADASRSADILSPTFQAAAENQAGMSEPSPSQSEPPSSSQSEQVTSGDELEWTRLFLHHASGASPFSTLKICIVQRDDTLEDIAARYNVQPRELQLHNSLDDPHVSEGQVLYIPK